MSVAAAARKVVVKESTAHAWWKKLQENPDTFTLEKKNLIAKTDRSLDCRRSINKV